MPSERCPYCGRMADEVYQVCVACGASFPEYRHGCELPHSDHHCDEKRIALIEAKRKSHGEMGRIYTPPYGQRLSDGTAREEWDDKRRKVRASDAR